MFPHTSIISVSDFSKLYTIAVNEALTHEAMTNKSMGGMIWEIPLDSSIDNLKKLEIDSVGPSKRSVTILALPNIGTQNDLDCCALDIASLMKSMRYEQVIIDHSLQGGSSPNQKIVWDFLFEIYNAKNTLIEKFLNNQDLKCKFFELGEKIFERVKNKGSFYIYEKKEIGIPKFINGKFETENLIRTNLNNFFENAKSKKLETDEQKVIFYFDLLEELNTSYSHLSQIGSTVVNIKESCFEAIKDIVSMLEKMYIKSNDAVKMIVEKTDILGKDDNLDSRIKKMNELVSYLPSSDVVEKIFVDQILKEINLKSILQKSCSELKNTDACISKQLNLMESILSNESEEKFIQDLGAWKKAWKDGDIKTLKNLKDNIPEMSYTSEEFQQVTNRIKNSIEQNKSSLFILPIKSFVDDENIIDSLVKDGITPKQIIGGLTKNMPEARKIKGTVYSTSAEPSNLQVMFYPKIPEHEKSRGIFYRIVSPQGKTVGHLLGTIHFANEKMIRLNSPIVKAIVKANTIYLEVKPGDYKIDMKALKPALPDNLDLLQKEKINNFIDLIFPKLIEKMKKIGMSAEKITLISDSFLIGDFETKVNQVYAIINEIVKFHTKIAHSPDLDPIGIDMTIAHFAAHQGIDIHGLEENNIDRINLLMEMQKSENYSSKAIAKLPVHEEGVERYIEKQIRHMTKMCEAWNTGDETYFKILAKKSKKNPELDKLTIIDRDIAMADKIDTILKIQKEGNQAFFAIGTLHISGNEENVISIFEKKRWSFEKM